MNLWIKWFVKQMTSPIKSEQFNALMEWNENKNETENIAWQSEWNEQLKKCNSHDNFRNLFTDFYPVTK